MRYEIDAEDEPPVPHMLAQEEYKTTNDTEYDSSLLRAAEGVPAEGEAMEVEAEGEGGGEVTEA